MRLTHLGSHATDITPEDHDYQGLAVLSDGTVVVYGKKEGKGSSCGGGITDNDFPGFGPDFHLFKGSATEWTKLKELPRPCKHGVWRDRMLPVRIGNQELLAVSCSWCEVIRLLNLQRGEFSTAFQENRYYPRNMCGGDEGQIFVRCRDKEKNFYVILLLDCSSTEFSIVRSITLNKEYLCLEFYIPRHRLLAAHDASLLKAVCCEDGRMVWGLELNFEFPHAEYSPQCDALLVSSWQQHQEVGVVNAADGVLRQTLQLPKDVQWLHDTRLHKDQLIVLYESAADDKNTLKMGFFSLQ